MKWGGEDIFHEVAKIREIAQGGLIEVDINDEEIVLCNFDGNIYAVEKRCGHMSAPVNRRTLEAYILTCPMHHAQFDVRTGEMLAGPQQGDFGDEIPPPGIMKYFEYIADLMTEIKTRPLKTFPVKIDRDTISVDVG